MNCFTVWLKSPNRQIKVYHYAARDPIDRKRAEKLARAFADAQHAAGRPCTVEWFDMLPDVGTLIYDTGTSTLNPYTP